MSPTRQNVKCRTLVCSAFFILGSVQLFSQQPNTPIRSSKDTDLDSLIGAFDFKGFLLGDVNGGWQGIEGADRPVVG